jgi:hypothetical protein
VVSSEELIGTAECLTLQSSCRINISRYKQVPLYLWVFGWNNFHAAFRAPFLRKILDFSPKEVVHFNGNGPPFIHSSAPDLS